MARSKGTCSVEAFLSQVDKKGPIQPHMKTRCHEWTGTMSTGLYGLVPQSAGHDATRLSHRVAWSLHTGASAGKNFVLHRCDNRKCVRPSHLFLGDAAINAQDMAKKGRQGLHTKPERAARGERHSQAKLTAKQVAHIRSLLDAGETHRAIGAAFGVSHQTIGYISRGLTWQPAGVYVSQRKLLGKGKW